MLPRLSLVVLFLCSCGSLGQSLTLDDFVQDARDADVVFFGEEHDNTVGHTRHLELLRLLHAERPGLALSMEMFERDVQSTLDAYLAGEIDEAKFLADSRPWKNYERDYRPMVEYAKEHGIPVIAANAPGETVKRFRREELDSTAGLDHVAAITTAPKDAYWAKFSAAMEGHMGVDESSMFPFYAAQCLRDDTMAESIVRVLESSDDPPLVVHVCGKFHAANHLGTVSRVKSRRSGVRCVVLSMETDAVCKDGEDHYVLVVPAEPKEDESAEGDDGDVAAGPSGRPALGFMPDYDSEDGVPIKELREGGPAEKAGLLEGDVVLRVDGDDVTDFSSYMEILGSLTVGSMVDVVVDRDGQLREFKVKVGERSH